MKELLLAHADVRTAQFPSLMQTVCKTLTDGEASVRTLLPALLAAVLPLVPTSTLGPHLPTLLLHATSALSSIFPAVRVDAVRVLGVLLDEGSDDGRDKITDGWETGAGGRGEGGRVLEGLLAVLGVGGKGETAGSNAPLGTAVRLRASPQMLALRLPDAASDARRAPFAPLQSKLVVFQALLRFLTHALSDRALAQSTADRPPSLAFLSASFATPHAFDQFATALAPAPAGVRPGGKGKARAGEWAVGLSGWERGDLELEGAGGEVDKGRKITVSITPFRLLRPNRQERCWRLTRPPPFRARHRTCTSHCTRCCCQRSSTRPRRSFRRRPRSSRQHRPRRSTRTSRRSLRFWPSARSSA